jgi:zinc transporter ZupT
MNLVALSVVLLAFATSFCNELLVSKKRLFQFASDFSSVIIAGVMIRLTRRNEIEN